MSHSVRSPGGGDKPTEATAVVRADPETRVEWGQRQTRLLLEESFESNGDLRWASPFLRG